ncbi:MAG TPA: hypothetical protein VK053_22595 [Jiangellaceae bacterium]|nr:hypothetical protein [Jiangellaceae bacterium]
MHSVPVSTDRAKANAEADAAQGLVTCAITGRTYPSGPQSPSSDGVAVPSTPESAAAAYRPLFPSADLVGHAADLLPRAPRWDGSEGPRWHIKIAPGAISVGTTDRARQERALERQQERDRKFVDMVVSQVLADTPEGEEPVWPAPPPSRREVTGWSRKSRTNMVRSLCELDYSPLFDGPDFRPLAMITLTYPGDWLTVAPNGKEAKRHLAAFRRRYERAWGEPLAAVWKLEFQRRGAPHYHLLMRPPQGRAATPGARARADAKVGAGLEFRTWLSEVWADIVAHPDPEERRRHRLAGTGIDWNEGLKARDPRRVAVYFTKHGSFAAKEYQHCVPTPWQEPGQGPGRFWGYWHLEKAVYGAEVSPGDAIAVGRVLRRWAHAQGVTRQMSVERINTRTGEVRRRTVRRRAVRLAANRGFVSVNDGASMGAMLARWVSATEPESAADRRARWAVLDRT